MPCAKNKPPCAREGCGDCEARSLFARKGELFSRNIECMLSDADMRTTSVWTRESIAFKCTVCLHKLSTKPCNILSRGDGCSYCNGTAKNLCGDVDCDMCTPRSIFVYKEVLADRKITCTLGDIDMLKTARFSNDMYTWRCDVCAHTWTAGPRDVVGAGVGCNYCAGHCQPCGKDDCAACAPRALFAYKNELETRGIESALGVSTMKTTSGQQNLPKLPWRCLVCGNEWTAAANMVCGTKKTGCTMCGKTFRVTENRIRDAVRNMDLGDVEIAAEDREWVPECGVDGNMRYRFDIRADVIEDGERSRFFVVEVDGDQHFGPVSFRGSTRSDHSKQLRNDVEKMAWAFERGVPIVRVPTSVAAWGSTEREHDWVAKLTELCRDAVEWCPTEDGDYPLFVYPGKEWMYVQHIDELDKVLRERTSKRIRVT